MQLMSLIVKKDKTLAPVATDSAANLGVDYTAGKRHRSQASPTFVGRLKKHFLRTRKIAAMHRATSGKMAHKLSLCGGSSKLISTPCS